jgi:hypothetical protein
MISLHPNWSKTQSMAAVAPSIAYPCFQAPRAKAQPTSGPGQPSGIQGPRRPIQRPVDFSMTENSENPCRAQQPATIMRPRHATSRGCGPLMKREPAGSAIIAAHPSKSSRR